MSLELLKDSGDKKNSNETDELTVKFRGLSVLQDSRQSNSWTIECRRGEPKDTNRMYRADLVPEMIENYAF